MNYQKQDRLRNRMNLKSAIVNWIYRHDLLTEPLRHDYFVSSNIDSLTILKIYPIFS